MSAVTLKQRYEQLETDREPYLSRARDASALTINSLIPPKGHSPSTKLPTPFQGLGARGVNNLSSKLLLIILPINAPFFRLTVDDTVVAAKLDASKTRGKIDKALAKMERAVMTDVETSNIRVPMFEAVKHLLVAGNILGYFPDDGGMRLYHLDKYVVKRDASGSVLETIAVDKVDARTLDKALRVACKCTDAELGKTKDVTVYTGVVRKANGWKVWQEINDVVVPTSVGTYPLDNCPWLPLRLIPIDGEDYGRGYVEEYMGDLTSLEALTAAVVEGSAAAAKVLFLVNPNGTTNPKVLEAPNCAVRPGRDEDVGVVQMDKFNDFRVAYEVITQISERLSFAFLLNSSVQRNAERVTAEEIRLMASELDDALGGIYSILAQELQLPMVRLYLSRMQRQRRLPYLPKGIVRPTITTGLQALGRGHELNRLKNFLGEAQAVLGPEQVLQYLNGAELLDRIAAATGVDTEDLIRTQEEVTADQQNAQMAALMERIGPELTKQMGAAGKPQTQ